MAQEESDRPTFRGCVFCYSAEWAYYGAKKAVRRSRNATRETPVTATS